MSIYKKIKVFAGDTKLCELYPYATRWEVMKFRAMKLFRKAVMLSFALGVIYGAFEIGQVINPKTTYAIVEKQVIVPDTTLPPILERIITCESGGQQFDKNGYVLRGKVNPEDWGLAQINVDIWGAKSKELGFDITTEAGNRAMAQWILDNKGTSPWSSSAKCWSK